MDRKQKFGLIFFVMACFTWTGALALPSAQTTIWQIGKFDGSSREFSSRLELRNRHQNPVFIIGKSATNQWPAFQPGSANEEAGGRPHPYTIRFRLDSRPKGTYRLTISALLFESRVPHLQISVNGNSGIFYFNRKLTYSSGEPAFWSPIDASDEITIVLPRSALREGDNDLVLTALDDPKDGPGDSLLAYDALRLTQDPAAKPNFTARLAVTPTIFYVRQGVGPTGPLLEVVRVTVTLGDKARRGEVRLRVNHQTYHSALSSEPDFGEQRFDFQIPEMSGATPAEADLRVNGKTLRKQISLVPERKWVLYLAPHEHLDVGYTDYRGKVEEIHDRNVDKLVDLITRHPEMRWNLDGSWIVRNYLATRTPAAQQAFINLAQQSKIAVPAEYANLLTGYASLEELIRSVFYSYRLHSEKSIPFDYANITDVPSYSWSYASVLHALGIRYFAAASNNDRAPILLIGRWNTKSPFWWEGPDGSKVLMSYSRQYSQLAFMCGLPGKVPACRQSIPTFLQAYDRPSYKPDVALVYGFQVENSDLIPGEVAFVHKWNSLYAYPRIRISTFLDYMKYMDAHYGKSLPVVNGDGGPYWEDGIGTDARNAAIDRVDQQRALSAEKLSTIGASVQKTVAGPVAQIRRMWRDQVLYAEHTFTSWGSYERPDSDETVRQSFAKDQFVIDARQQINSVLDQSFSQLADQIHIPAPAIVVFNSLSWARSGLVETDLDDGWEIRQYPDMKPVPVEVLQRGAGYSHVRFMARDVPSFGYRCYAMVQLQGNQDPKSPSAASGSLPLSNTIENAYYRVTFDPATGAIGSIYDKQLDKELVNPSGPYRLNQYLYVSGGEGSQIVELGSSLPLARLTVTTSNPGRVISVRKTSYGERLTYQTSGRDAPAITTDVVLFDHLKKIEFIDHLQKTPDTHKEAVYFAFPFASSQPDFSYEVQNGWVNPSRNILKGGSLEWFTVQHWVRVQSPEFSAAVIPIDAPLVSLGDINRGLWPAVFKPKSATIFSYAMNNYWHTNYYRVQGGSYTFRYVLTSGSHLSPASLARLGREVITPLEHRQVISNDKYDNPTRPLSPAPASFLEISSPNVIVEDWKRAEDGNGTIVRLLEVGGRSVTASLTFPLFNVHQAWATNAVEENQSQLSVDEHSVQVTMRPHEIATLRVIASNAGQTQDP
jgi:alpha-mannosidase